MFSQELGSETCQQTEWLVKEVVELTDKASVEVLNLILDREKAEGYGVDRVPAVVVEGSKNISVFSSFHTPVMQNLGGVHQELDFAWTAGGKVHF